MQPPPVHLVYTVRIGIIVAVLACGVAGGCDARVLGVALPAGSPSVAAPPAASLPMAASVAASPAAAPAAAAGFVGTSAPETAADLPYTWRPGCPVGPDRLRLLRLSFWGFDDRPHLGTMVVHEAVVADVVAVFRMLYRQRFPIRRMQPEDAYRGSDPDSMTDDNTSAFNCRPAVAPGPAHWSAHAYGQAVDVNTVENPYLDGGAVLPPAGAAYRDRGRYRPGMALPGGPLVQAFAAVGWRWGGRWSAAPDYQHFSRTGG